MNAIVSELPSNPNVATVQLRADGPLAEGREESASQTSMLSNYLGTPTDSEPTNTPIRVDVGAQPPDLVAGYQMASDSTMLSDDLSGTVSARVSQLPANRRWNAMVRQPSFIGNPPAITNRLKDLINIFWCVVLSKALQSGLHPTGAIDVENDEEDDTSQVVLRVFLDVSPSQAIAFWDGLAVDLDRWFASLDETNRSTVQRDIGLRIHWK